MRDAWELARGTCDLPHLTDASLFMSHASRLAVHFKTPHAFMVARRISRFRAAIGTRGSRYSSSICPSIARAAFTGTGLVSINRSLNNGWYCPCSLRASETFPAAYALTIRATARGLTLE